MGLLHNIRLFTGIARDVLIIIVLLGLVFGILMLMSFVSQAGGMMGGI